MISTVRRHMAEFRHHSLRLHIKLPQAFLSTDPEYTGTGDNPDACKITRVVCAERAFAVPLTSLQQQTKVCLRRTVHAG